MTWPRSGPGGSVAASLPRTLARVFLRAKNPVYGKFWIGPRVRSPVLCADIPRTTFLISGITFSMNPDSWAGSWRIGREKTCPQKAKCAIIRWRRQRAGHGDLTRRSMARGHSLSPYSNHLLAPGPRCDDELGVLVWPAPNRSAIKLWREPKSGRRSSPETHTGSAKFRWVHPENWFQAEDGRDLNGCNRLSPPRITS